MSNETGQTDTPTKPKRMTLSEVVEQLLQRGSAGPSSVTLSRNAKGETQLEVVVRTGEHGEVQTIGEAELVAVEVYDRLRTLYPMSTDAPAGGGSQ